MAFDYSMAEKVRQERAAKLLAEEEARHPELGIEPETGGGLRAYSLNPTIGANYDFVPERRLFDAIIVALESAGVESLAPPKIETREANITYTIHAKVGQDLLEFMLSSLSQRVLVRSSRNKGGLLSKVKLDLAKLPSVTGEGHIVGLNLESYVMQKEDGELLLHNEEQLLRNLNEFILNKYDLHATRLVGGADTEGGNLLTRWWAGLSPSQRVLGPAVAVGVAAMGLLAVMRVSARSR